MAAERTRNSRIGRLIESLFLRGPDIERPRFSNRILMEALEQRFLLSADAIAAAVDAQQLTDGASSNVPDSATFAAAADDVRVAVGPQAPAVTIEWINPAGGDWNDPANWQGN